jgi:hypothetical protein
MMRLPSHAIWPRLIACMLSVSVLWMTLVVPAESFNRAGNKAFFKQALLATVHSEITKQDSPGTQSKSSCVVPPVPPVYPQAASKLQHEYQVLLPVSARSAWYVYTSIHAP